MRTNSSWRGWLRGAERAFSVHSLLDTLLTALFHFDFGAGIFKLFLDGGGFVLVHAFFDRFRRAVNEVLGFLQSEAGDFANRFDDVNFVGTDFGQHHRKFGLPPARTPPPPRAPRSRRGTRRSRRYAKGLFHLLDQV